MWVSILTKKTKKLIIIYILLIIVLGIITITIPQVTGALTKTEILEYENMQITDDVTCYIVRDESVHMAPSAGRINYYVEDGVKVRKNVKILDLVPGDSAQEESKYNDIITRLGSSDVVLHQVASAQNGIVSYYIDGYESYFTPEKMTTLSYETTKKQDFKSVNLTRGNTLRGEPLFKVCQSNMWYIMAWIDTENISKYEVGDSVKIQLPLGEVDALVDQIIDQGDKWLVIMKTTRYYEEFAKIRSADVQIITQEYTGIKVRNSSITTEDGVAGVYVKTKNGEFVFKPIKVITSDGDYSLVYSSKFYDAEGQEVLTVEVYDEILKNPSQNTHDEEEVNS